MTIFNSLGSNYNFRYASRSLFASNSHDNYAKLAKFLRQKYGGQVLITYKGREAIRLALKSINKSKEYTVGICGYTCYAVYEAVTKEGYPVEYLDVPTKGVNFTAELLKKAYAKNPKLKIVIVQNTLGYPCDIENIVAFCKEKEIILIEDLAHSIGTTYATGQEAGAIGDFVVLSFSQDKLIDAVSGGAVVIRNSAFKLPRLELKKISAQQQRKDRRYPFFTFIIRKTYKSGVGKILHFLFKNTRMLSQPMDYLDTNEIYRLPNWYCLLGLKEFQALTKNLNHRRKIAIIYTQYVPKKLQWDIITERVSLSSNLRFPIFVEDRESLISYLREKNVYVSDIWYDAPIAPKKYIEKTNYAGQCKNAEQVSKVMLNLPTHRNVSESQAKQIAKLINEWAKKISI